MSRRRKASLAELPPALPPSAARPVDQPRAPGEPVADAPPAAQAPQPHRQRVWRRGSATTSRITGLVEHALTHVSALKGPRNPARSYQRLEFLGDHVLGLVISDMLFRAFPRANEGELSRRLADLVRKETCADVARAIDLGAAVKLGGSEAQGGGRRRTTILGRCVRGSDRVGVPRRRLCGRGRLRRAVLARTDADAGATVARPQDPAAGMGAGARDCRRRPIAR